MNAAKRHAPAGGAPEHKTFRMAVTAVKANEAGTEAEFEGYASVFGNKDLGGDIVMAGAFTKTLSDSQGKPFPLLADHDYTLKGRLGVAYCTQDSHGLRVKGIINLESDAGRETYSHLKQAEAHGVDLGMSFGYSVPQGKATFDREKGARLIHEVKLYEVTITQFPMNPEAGVEDVKASFLEYFDRYRESGMLSAEYWAIEDARYMAVDDALYSTEDPAAERLARLDENLTAYHAALMDWARRYLDFYEVKEHDPAQEKRLLTERDLLRHQHTTIRQSIKALQEVPAPEPVAGTPAGKATTPDPDAADPQPAPLTADEAKALQLEALLASLQSITQEIRA